MYFLQTQTLSFIEGKSLIGCLLLIQRIKVCGWFPKGYFINRTHKFKYIYLLKKKKFPSNFSVKDNFQHCFMHKLMPIEWIEFLQEFKSIAIKLTSINWWKYWLGCATAIRFDLWTQDKHLDHAVVLPALRLFTTHANRYIHNLQNIFWRMNISRGAAFTLQGDRPSIIHYSVVRRRLTPIPLILED
jgi:hypothetical protein